MNIEKLKTLGREWKSPDGSKQRIYFNYLPEWFGLKREFYHTGNIKWAWLNGEKIFNAEAYRVVERFRGAKIWYDFSDNEFHGHIESFDYLDKIQYEEIAVKDFDVVVASISSLA